MKHSESLTKIAPALIRAQRKIHGVVANQKNPFFKSEYADLEACWGAVKDALHSEDIALIQTMGFIAGGGPTLNTTLLHQSGEYISGEQPVCAKDSDPQAMGSAISYARRYGLSAMVSLVEVDDDGEKAMSRPNSGPAMKPNLQAVPSDPGAYVVRLGKKLVGKRLDEIDLYELDGFSKYLQGQKRDALGNETLAAVEAYLKTRETGRAK